MDGCRKYQHVSGKISVFGVRGVYIGERKKRGGGHKPLLTHPMLSHTKYQHVTGKLFLWLSEVCVLRSVVGHGVLTAVGNLLTTKKKDTLQGHSKYQYLIVKLSAWVTGVWVTRYKCRVNVGNCSGRRYAWWVGSLCGDVGNCSGRKYAW